MSNDPALTTSELLKPYVPRLVIDWLRESPGLNHRQVDGTLAFCDISGFTELTERLSRKGKAGSEEMNDILDRCFADLLDVAYDYGASVIKWGGDAVLLLFTDDCHEARACRAAWEMQKELGRVGRAQRLPGRTKLGMSIGIGSGLIDCFLVGSLHRELIVTGAVVNVTVAVESAAVRGQVAVGETTAAALAVDCLGEAIGPGRLLVRAPEIARSRAPEVGDVDDLDLESCIPVEVARYLAAGGGDAEHRPMTAAFIHFMGVDDLLAGEGPGAVAEALDRCLTEVERITESFRVAIFDTDIAPDGGKIMLMAGAPVSAGNDEERMLRATRAILDADLPLPMRIGVNQGRIFVANFGPSYRRTYSVKADAVNLAARLMSKAEPGQLIASDDTLARSRTSFEAHALPPFLVKGKAEPIHAHLVGEPLIATSRDEGTPLVGRASELALLLDALADARMSEGRLVEIVAEPGMGKSALVAAAQREAADFRLLTVQCDEYESSTPYYPLHGLLRDFLELGADGGIPELELGLRRRAPHLLPWLPLVATAIGMEAADTPETAALDEQFRKQRLELTVVELLGMVLLTPTLLVFEDVHWLDDATAETLSTLARQIEARPWLVVLTKRDQGRSFTEADGTTIRLDPLGESEVAELLAEATADQPLQPHELEQLSARAGGNPLFLMELLAAARSPEGLTHLPDSVESLLMVQIDRLAPRDRRALRSAAVVGVSFTQDLLEAATDVHLDAALYGRLADFFVDEGGGRLRFRHALVRDAAYEGLPYRRRRELHESVGQAIEARVAQPEAEAELLSLHFFSAGDLEKAWRYSRIAGNRAKDIFANVEAETFFERALATARRLRVPADEIAELSEALGDVRVRLGEFDTATEAFRKARSAASTDAVDRARLMLKEATIAWRLGRYNPALRWLGRALRELEATDSDAAGAERARACATTGLIRGRQGRRREAIDWLERAISEAEASGAEDARALALYLLDHQYEAIGRLDSVSNSERALEIYEELGDVERQAIVLNSLGVYAHAQGRWGESVDFYDRAQAAWEQAGNTWAASFATTNRGEVLSDQGRLDEAEPLFRAALRVARASRSPSRVADVSMYLGRLLARRGEFEEAQGLFAEAREQFSQSGDRSEVLSADARVAEALALAGAPDEALALAERTSLEAAATEGMSMLVPLLGRVRGCALAELGRCKEARQVLAQSLSASRELNMDYEIALTLSALLVLPATDGDSVAEAGGGVGLAFLVVRVSVAAPGLVARGAARLV